jgi:hypothetical protein
MTSRLNVEERKIKLTKLNFREVMKNHDFE